MELLLFLGILFFGSLLLFLFSSVENAVHEKNIELLTSNVGGGRILSDLLTHPVSGDDIGTLIRTGSDNAPSAIQQYLATHEPLITRYRVTRNNEIIVESEQQVDEDARVTTTLHAIDITLEYRK
jgi:hypothetical protein